MATAVRCYRFYQQTGASRGIRLDVTRGESERAKETNRRKRGSPRGAVDDRIVRCSQKKSHSPSDSSRSNSASFSRTSSGNLPMSMLNSAIARPFALGRIREFTSGTYHDSPSLLGHLARH